MSLFVEPGVKTRELDFSNYVNRVSSTILGMVGGATKGPINKPTLCVNAADFTRKFGEPPEGDLGALSAVTFLRRGSQLWYTRVAGETNAVASATLDATDVAEADLTDFLTFTMKEAGTFAHDYSLQVVNPEGLDFELHIIQNGVVRGVENLSLDDSEERYVGNFKHSLFDVEVGEGTATGISAQTVTFAGGDDGLPLAKDAIVTGLGYYSDPRKIDINVLCAPARYEDTVVAKITEICESRADCFGLIDPPQASGVQGVIDYHNGTSVEADTPVTRLESSFTGIFYPWVKVQDPFSSSEEVWLPPSAVVSGAFAYNDKVGEPWNAPSGLNRGMVDLVLDTEDKDEDYTELYIKDNAINPIIDYKDSGFIIWGQFTLQRKETATNRINVRRMVSLVRKIVRESSERFTFEPNDEFTWALWKAEIEPHLERIKTDRGMHDYRVVMDSTTTTGENIDNNEMIGQVGIKPTKTAEYILIDFVLRATSEVM